MKLWVDDERPAPPGWVGVRDVPTAIWTLLGGNTDQEQDAVLVLSLDHDFGINQPTGYDLLYCMARLKLTVPIIQVHSMNPDGKAAMVSLIEQFELAR